jgi:hypothetical protein
MNCVRILLTTGTLVLLAGCSSPVVHFDYDSHAAYAGFHSFAWQGEPGEGRGVFDNPIVDARVKRAVEVELNAKGFTLATAGAADFLMAYYPVREGSRSSQVHLGLGLGLGPLGLGIGAPVGGRPEALGGIVLEIQDSRTRTLVWKATAEGALQGSDSPEEADADVKAAVHGMLKNFPPKG